MRCKQKEKIINKIKCTENWDMLDKIEDMFEKEPQHIADYIDNLFYERFPDDNYHNNVVMYAFESDIRKIYIKIGNKLKPSEDYITHFSELCVADNRGYEEPLDMWIMERNFCFDACMLATAIFDIWCNKVTFKGV